jgi:hypothetical protein
MRLDALRFFDAESDIWHQGSGRSLIRYNRTEGLRAAVLARRRYIEDSLMFRKTTMRRAIAEGALIYTFGLLLALPQPSFWPTPIFLIVLLLRLALFVIPPVWAAMRVVSTKREKMSARFWRLGPILATWCELISALLVLFVGQIDGQWGGLLDGPAGTPALGRFLTSGPAHLTPLDFLVGQLGGYFLLLVYYTIAVVLTRLANGGFLRFTMPAGGNRVTL